MRRDPPQLHPAALAAIGLTTLAMAHAVLAPSRLTAQEGEAVVVYLVRHAETLSDGTSDPALSGSGRERAARLARMMAGTGLTAVHATSYERARETAERVANAVGLTVREYDPGDLRALATKLLEEGGRHLVVGHSNTTPALVQALGGDPGGPIPEDEYGRVYVVTAETGATRTLVAGYPGGFLADPPPAPGSVPPARAEDVESLESIVAALYDVISGPAGVARDWDRLRSLFLPSARMLPVQRRPDGEVRYRALAVEEYIQGSGSMIESMGFREVEVARRVERFGEVAHVFSTYEGHREGVEEPIVSGLNSIQLIHDGDRWWIASLAWAPARSDLPLPPRYRRGGGG